jgi:hypothetical protein
MDSRYQPDLFTRLVEVGVITFYLGVIIWGLYGAPGVL